MPKTYWDLFQQATAQVQDCRDLDRGHPRGGRAASPRARRRRHRVRGKCDRRRSPAATALPSAGRENDLRAALLGHFRAQLAERTPDLLARAVGIPHRTTAADARAPISTSAPSRARSSSIWCNRRSPRRTARASGPDASARSWGASSPHGSPNAAWRRVRSRATTSPSSSSTAPPRWEDERVDFRNGDR